jgi:hypothetical protein
MPDQYTTGTINQPDAGSLGLAMAERIRDDLTAHAAWDLVEEFTPAGGAARFYVMRCLAASNGLGSDFFLVMGRTLANGELRFAICEATTPRPTRCSITGQGISPFPPQWTRWGVFRSGA